MTTPTYFTVVADYKSVVVDSASDVDADPQLGPVTAKVTFTPVLRSGDVILATDASPRPTGFVAAPIVGRIDTDGRLKLRVEPDGDRDDFANLAAFPATGNTAKVYFAIDTQTFYRWDGSTYEETYPYAPVRLLADTPLLELDSDLYYRVTFSDVVFNGSAGYIAPFTFQAPNTDTELNLIEVMRQPGQPASGITKIAPGAVRVVDGNKLQFSFAGVDIPDPVDVNITADVIEDSGAVGRELVRASNTSQAWTALGTVPTNNLPSYVDDVLEFNNLAAFPATGETGKIYLAKDTGQSFRWSGSQYVRINTFGTPVAVKTASYAAQPGDIVRADTSGGGFTITLPESPSNGSAIWVKKIDTTANAVIVQRSGSDVFNVTGGPSTMQLAVPGQSAALHYDSGVWHVLVQAAPVAALDDRYFMRGTDILDTNNNTSIRLAATANAVNYVEVTNTASGAESVQIRPAGTDTHLALNLRAKGVWGGVQMLDANGAVMASYSKFGSSSATANYWQFLPGAANDPIVARAAGSDSAINIELTPKGAGKLRSGGVDVALVSTAQTLTDKTITDGKFNALKDTNGNNAVALSATSNAVNYLQISNSASGSEQVNLRALGTDTHIAVTVRGKGTFGGLTVLDNNGANIAGFSTFGSSAATANSWRFAPGSAGNPITASAIGTDTDVSIELTPKGAGKLRSGGVDVALVSGAQTITGKTISGADNTLSNIPQSAVTSLTTDLAGKVPSSRTVNSKALSTDVTLTQDDVGDGTTNKQFSATEKTKLAGIASGATANSADATLLSRANHTGTQTASTISDFSTAADARIAIGNAATATALQTARTINGVSFDGTANITVADSTKEPTIAAGTTAQYWRGDKSWQTLEKTAVGLSNVDNTSDANKPVSTATQTALDLKANAANAALTGTVKLATAGAIEVYNSADQTTNYGRVALKQSGSTIQMIAENAGSGTMPNMLFAGASAYLYLHAAAQGPTTGTARILSSTNAANATQFGVNGTLSASSGTQYGVSISPTYNQSSTAGYTALLVNATETATGSGTKRLLDAQVGGSSKFTVDNTGRISMSGTTATVSAGAGSPESAVTANVGSLYLRTDGGAATALYVKESGAGNTGWVAK